jgi:hypothetical protein
MILSMADLLPSPQGPLRHRATNNLHQLELLWEQQASTAIHTT